ncbi:VCBS repeat-containing protein [Candidatus Dependentiae bacterium]|nr:VCBS repeat-containing protein [Candidatus Dependentiae bacterium]
MKKVLYIVILFFIFNQSVLCDNSDFRVLTGFPYATFGDFYGNGAVADIDADGIKEFIIGDKSGYVYAVQSNGISKSGFPVFLGDAIWSSPAIADVDNDGKSEIIIGSKNSKINVIKFDGTLASGFPVELTQEIRGAPSIADIDKNGTPDIIVPGLDGYIYVIDGSGRNLSGWPQRIVPNTENSAYNFDYGSRTTVLITDYDMDGYFEITVCANGGVFSIFRHNGERILSSKINARIDAPPAAADIDNDGKIEFIITGWDYYAYIFNIDSYGKIVYKTNYPFYFNELLRCHPAIYDFNDDGLDDMIFFILTNYNAANNPGRFLILENNADFLSIPYSDSSGVSCPVLANLDNDTEIEIAVVTYGGELQIYNHNGSAVKYQYSMPGKKTMESTPVLNDFDNDGKMDIVVATQEQFITALTLEGSADYNSVYNSKFMFTLNNTGNNFDFSTPLIYEPTNNLIHDTAVTFKWIQMENISGVKSSYRLNNSDYSDSDFISEKTFSDLTDGEYVFTVDQYFKNKKTMTPGYRKIIIDNKLPEACLTKTNFSGGGIINLNGTASDSNFYCYNIKILSSSGITVADNNFFNVVIDTGTLYSFNSIYYPDDTYTAYLTVFETDTSYFSFDTALFSVRNESAFVSPSQNSVFNADNGNIKINIPVKTVDKNLKLIVYKWAAEDMPGEISFVSNKYMIEIDDTSVTKNLDISIKILDSLQQVQSAHMKKPIRYNPQNVNNYYIAYNNGIDSIWLNIGGYYDFFDKTVTVSFNKSEIYAVAINPGLFVLEYKLPVALNKRILQSEDDEIIVQNISGSAEISIFDINGKLILKSNKNKWNGKDKNGRHVKSGLYILISEDCGDVFKNVIYVK